MKLISILLVGVAIVGTTCLVGYASAVDRAPGELISDSILVAQDETVAPGGRGGGTAGETGRADRNTPTEYTKQGTPGDTKPGTAKDTTPTGGSTGSDIGGTGMGGSTGSDSGRSGSSSGSSGSGSGPSSGAGSGAK